MRTQLPKIAAAIALPAMLAACQTSGPDSDDIAKSHNAAHIDYRLPFTAAKVEMQLLLTGCSASTLEAVPTVNITPVAATTPNPNLHFTVDSNQLRSFFKSRDVTISLHDNGALKSINATTKDKTGSIIGNVLSFAAKIALPFLDAASSQVAAGTPSSSGTICNQATQDALMAANNLAQKIDAERASIRSGAGNLAAIKKNIDVLASELTHLQAQSLRLTLRQTILFEKDVHTRRILWTKKAFAKWLATPTDDTTNMFALGICTYPDGDSRAEDCNGATTNSASDGRGSDLDPGKPDCKEDDQCARTLVLRDPVPATMRVFATDSSTGFNYRAGLCRDKTDTPPYCRFDGVARETPLAAADLLVAQWGELNYFPYSVGFGGSRTLSLSLDPYGRKTSMGSSASAGGEGITGFLATTADTVSSTVDSLDGKSLAEKQATVTELQTQLTLNQLEACRATIENGGYTCPETSD